MTRRYLPLALPLFLVVAAQACELDAERVLTSDAQASGAGGSRSDLGFSGHPGGQGAGAPGGELEGGGAGGQMQAGPKTVLVVLEGLRRELVSEELMPNVWRIAQEGVSFARHLSVLPSNRMAAAGSLATGVSPAQHGVLGARLYLPSAKGSDAAGRALDSQQPLSIEDRGTLESLQLGAERPVLRAKSFVEVLRDEGIGSIVVGRRGPATLFDVGRAGYVLDDDYVSPRAFAQQVAGLGLGLPDNVHALFPDLTGPSAYVPLLGQDVFPNDATIRAFLSPNWAAVPVQQAYGNPLVPLVATRETTLELEASALLLGLEDPAIEVGVLWLREPGETILRHGPGAAAAKLALTRVDEVVLQVERALPEGSTLLLVSDGGSSALAGDARFFPRWSVSAQTPPRWVQVDSPSGLPVDGSVRLTDVLSRAGFLAYDGEPCLSGHAYTAYPSFGYQPGWPDICRDESVNRKRGEQTGPALVPAELDPRALIVASDGAAELIYLPSHRASVMDELVAFLATRPEIGAIFAAPRYGRLPGVLDLGLLDFPRNADIDLLVTYQWDRDDAVGYAPQVEVPQRDGLAFDEVCGVRPCRSGLYCDGTCKFCPSDVDASACALSPTASLEAARGASAYVVEGGYCEATRFCEAGLECVYEQCRKRGQRPQPRLATAPSGFPRGSSYGAMSGVVLRTSASAAAERLFHDQHGVRGGASAADLSAFWLARGPAFLSGSVVENPTALTDVAPTLLHALRPGLEQKLTGRPGRVVVEALKVLPEAAPTFVAHTVTSKVAAKVPIHSPTRPSNSPESLLVASGKLTSSAQGFTLTQAGVTYRYWSEASASRSSLTCDDATRCPAGSGCSASGVCVVTPTCADGVQNGVETDIDCGFAAKCMLCSLGATCRDGRDCHSGRCGQDGACVEP